VVVQHLVDTLLEQCNGSRPDAVCVVSHLPSLLTGMKITPGSGISKAIEYWQSTSKIIPTRETP
jgi:hypothetical protein